MTACDVDATTTEEHPCVKIPGNVIRKAGAGEIQFFNQDGCRDPRGT